MLLLAIGDTSEAGRKKRALFLDESSLHLGNIV